MKSKERTAWNKGLKMSKDQVIKLKLVHSGIKLSDNHRKRISEGHIGLFRTQEHRKNLSKALTGKRIPEEIREKIRKTVNKNYLEHPEIKEMIKKARQKQVFPIKNTTIELKIQSFLKRLGITFLTHQYIKDIEHGYQCDILIPSMNLVIECDGDYWHKYPIGRDIDKIRTSELLQKGFKVLRLWEFEINKMTISEFKSKINNYGNI